MCASMTELGDIILQPVHLVFISRCTSKSIVSATDMLLFVEVSDRTLNISVVTYLHTTGVQVIKLQQC